MHEEKQDTGAVTSPLPSRKALPPFEALRAFDAVARLGGVRKAAQSLDRDHAVISRHIRVVEAWTGVTLIERTSTGTILTEDGQRYHKRIAEAIDAIASATLDLMKQHETRRLHIWCMPAFALHWLTPRLTAFESTNPGLDIEVRPTDSSPDFTSHEADIDIRFIATYSGELKLPAGLRSVELVQPPVIAVASPDYLSANRPIAKAMDLLHHQLLHEENFDGWKEWLAVHGVHDDTPLSGPRLWQGHLTLDAARHGRGIALTNPLVAGPDIASGRLIDIGAGKKDFGTATLGAYLFIARADRWNTPAISMFRHWLQMTVSADLPSPAQARQGRR